MKKPGAGGAPPVRRSGPWRLVWAMAAAVAVLLVVLLLTRGDDRSGVESLVAAAPRAVDGQQRAHLDLRVELDTQAFDISVEGAGIVDFESGASWFTMTLLDTVVELRTDGTTLYVLPQGQTTWLAVGADDAAALGSLGSFGTGPDEAIVLVDLLRGPIATIEDLGADDVGGEPARHLRLEVDLAAAAAAADDGRRSSIEALGAIAPGGTLDLEVWIDGRELPVRQRLRGEVEGVGLVMTLELSGWGDDLGVQIPPEGAVRDVEPEELAAILGAAPPG